jgi:major membrane immunogen (membrane-anchored lipoprotein)
MKKRLLALLICTCMLFTACGKSTNDSSKDASNDTAATKDDHFSFSNVIKTMF